jgi:enterochelin esterase-like enzyme
MNSEFITECKQSDSIDKMNLLIIEKLKKYSPVVEDMPNDANNKLVTFFYHGINLESVSIYSPLVGIFPKIMARLNNSDYFYYSLTVPANIRVTYAFTVNDQANYDDIQTKEQINATFIKMWAELIPDPNNPEQIILKTGDPRVVISISILEMPFAPTREWSNKNNSAPNGNLVKSEIDSSLLKSKRNYWTYLPASYSENIIYPVLIVFDGQFYCESGTSLPTILDNLIYANKIPPVIAVFIDSIGFDKRQKDLRGDTFLDFLINEFLPEIGSKYSISHRYQDRILMGASLGGFFSLYASLKRPDLFGKVLSQSDGDSIILSLINKTQTPLKLYLDIGSIENPEGIKRISELLSSAGHEVIFRTIPGAHDIVSWETAIPGALIELL